MKTVPARSSKSLARLRSIGRRGRKVKGALKPLFGTIKSDPGDIGQQFLSVRQAAVSGGNGDAKTPCKVTQRQTLNVRGGWRRFNQRLSEIAVANASLMRGARLQVQWLWSELKG